MSPCTCPVYQYQVQITSIFSDGVLKDISMSTDNQMKMNESFISLTWFAMKKALLKHQDGDVDTVSGATYTSSAIRTAYIRTLNMAKGEVMQEESSENDTETDSKEDVGEGTKDETEAKSEEETEMGSEGEAENESGDADSEEEAKREISMERMIEGNRATYIGTVQVDSQDADSSLAKGAFENYRIKMKIVFEAGVLLNSEIIEFGNGVFSGSGQGFGGPIDLEIVVENHQITQVNIISADGEDRAYYEQVLQVLPAAVIQAQNTDVDTVSGATFSSQGMLEAVSQAIVLAKEARPSDEELLEEWEENNEKESMSG